MKLLIKDTDLQQAIDTLADGYISQAIGQLEGLAESAPLVTPAMGAAPKLLEALQTVMRWIDNWDVPFDDYDVDGWVKDKKKALEAIAKATSE